MLRVNSGTTYQKLEEAMSPGLIVANFGRRSREGLVLCAKVCNNDSVDVGHCCFWYWVGLVVR